MADILYTVVVVLEHTCKCAMALPTSKLTFIVEAEHKNGAGMKARRMIRHMTKGRVLAIDIDKVRWEG